MPCFDSNIFTVKLTTLESIQLCSSYIKVILSNRIEPINKPSLPEQLTFVYNTT